MRAVQLARKERIATLLDDWTENDRCELGRYLARFNDELNRNTGVSAATEAEHRIPS
jgi:hypothetical protein